MTILFNVHYEVLRSLFHDTDLTIWHKVLDELFLFIRHQPSEVGLVLCIHTCHQLDVRTESLAINTPLLSLLRCRLVSEVTIPSTSEITITPGPLFLTRREVMTGYMQHTCLGVVLIASFKVVLRVNSHIAGWYIDILVVRDIYTSRIVHLIIGTGSDREARYSTLTMIEHSIDIGWEHTLIVIVHLYSWVCPPQEGLRHVGAIAHTTLNLQISTTRTKCKSCHTLLVEHTLHFVHPYSN